MPSSKSYLADKSYKRVLLVIAHPDDEAMFFIPTIYLLMQKKLEISVLCLSSTTVRKKELRNSLKTISYECGAKPIENIDILDIPELPDQMEHSWNIKEVLKHVSNALMKYNCNHIVTFDVKGVSGHKNHSSIPMSLLSVMDGGPEVLDKDGQIIKSCLLSTLHTNALYLWDLFYFLYLIRIFISDIPPLRCALDWILKVVGVDIKRIESLDGCVEMNYSVMDNKVSTVVVASTRVLAFKAMNQHYSQMVWFRYLWLCFSTYPSINVIDHRFPE